MARQPIREAKIDLSTGDIVLILKKPPPAEFPKVSVCTITKNRAHLLPIAYQNWIKFRYDPRQIEWVIVDDSDDKETEEMVKRWARRDHRIRYIRVPPLNIPDKRNRAIENCRGDVIVNMDDDDFHFPDSIQTKIRVLNEYDAKLVCSTRIGQYVIQTRQSYIAHTMGCDVAESSFAFYKSWWMEKKFAYGPNGEAEYYGLLDGRWKDAIDIPYFFNLIMCNHGSNVTKDVRQIRGEGETGSKSFEETFTDDHLEEFRKIRLYYVKKRVARRRRRV